MHSFSYPQSPSRILMTADASEGVWSYVMELARALRPSGTDILLAVMGPELSPQQRAQAARFVHVGLCERPFALEWMEDPWHDVAAAGDWLLELEEQFEPHVIHLNHYCHGSLPWNAPVMISAHGCVLSWRKAVCGERTPSSSWSRYHAEVSAGLRGANIVVAPTCAMLDSLTRFYTPARQSAFQSGLILPEFRAIPLGCDATRFRPTVKREYVFIMGCPGDKTQNLDMLNDLALDLPWPIILGCKGPHADVRCAALPHLHALHADAGELAQAQCQASIFAFPTRYDPFGRSTLEAALAGCALVLGDVPCLRETWSDAALFAPAEDKEAFAAVLHGLMDDGDLRREMAARARARALEMTPERMASSILECYQELAMREAVSMEMDIVQKTSAVTVQ